MLSARLKWMTKEPEEGRNCEQAMVASAQKGDLEAMEQMLSQHQQSLYALCRGMLANAHDAEDAVQETFLKAIRSINNFRGDASVRTWLSRIAINVCLDWKSARRPAESLTELEPADWNLPSPEAVVIRSMQITEALSSLHPRHRAVILLKELEGWSIPEIAGMMRWNEKRVENELYKARRALADWQLRHAEGH